MNQCELKSDITISLSKAACLVLFELLTESYEQWRSANPDDATAGPMVVKATSQSERVALWQVEGSIEKTLPEVFSSKYKELLAAAHGMLSRWKGRICCQSCNFRVDTSESATIHPRSSFEAGQFSSHRPAVLAGSRTTIASNG